MTSDDNDLGMVRYVPVTRRTGLDPKLFGRYWRDVHGTICAALPNLYLYTQYHLDPNQPDHWLAAENVSTVVEPAEAVDGIAECGFKTNKSFEDWLSGAQGLMDDEQNCFDGTYGYYTVDGASRTTKADVDRKAIGKLTVAALVRRREGVDDATFRGFIAEELSPAFAGSPLVLRHRHHLLEPYEDREADWRVHVVKSHVPEDRRYHAAIEFVVEDRLALRTFFGTDGYRRTIAKQDEMFAAVHPYPVRRSVVLVESGSPTLAGRRGWSTAELIRKVGAVNVA